MKKELVAEKAQWAYVQKSLSNELQLSQTNLNKIGAWMNKYHSIMHISGVAAGIGTLAILEYFFKENKGPVAGVALISCAVSISAFVATYLDKLLENKSGVCLKALNSFIQKWPEHKAQTPQILQGMFDGLYAKRQVKNCGLTDVQAQQLIEGVLALSVAAQVA